MRRSTFALTAVASLSSVLVAAQSSSIPLGYGRFPCTILNADGTLAPDASLCADAAFMAPGLGTGNAAGTQGDGANPTGAECVLQVETGAYFCGLAGAACTTSANCDNGHCVEGTCQGGFSQSCSEKDTNCLGYLYCLTRGYTKTESDTCGGIGAFCNDVRAASLDMTADAAQEIFDGFCQSGYCNFGTAQCDIKKVEGASCADDPAYGCAAGLVCSPSTELCVRSPTPGPGPSQRARVRARRAGASGHQAVLDRANGLPRKGASGSRGVCPAGREACAVTSGNGGFECVHTRSALEQCGGCAGQGGVDCTAVPNVAAVGCVQGVCEVWACEAGFVFDPSAQACVAA